MNVLHVVLEDRMPSSDIWKRYDDVTIEPTGSDEGFVERFGEVCGANQDHALGLGETV